MTGGLPETRDGRAPMTYKQNRQYSGGASDWKVARIIDAMIIGIDKEIDDPIVGRIPARAPLPLEQAARAVGLRLKKARQLQQEPEFRSALEACRATWELGSVAMALSIRDDPNNAPKERIRAAEFLRGPRPAAGVQVNVNQNNQTSADPHPAGYVILFGAAAANRRRQSMRKRSMHHRAAIRVILPAMSSANAGRPRLCGHRAGSKKPREHGVTRRRAQAGLLSQTPSRSS